MSKRKALKSIDSFLESQEPSHGDASDNLANRDRVGAIPEDVILKLNVMRSFMIPEDTVLSSSSVKDVPQVDVKKTKLETSAIDALTIKLELNAPIHLHEEIKVWKKTKRSLDGNTNITEKKKKSRKAPE